MPKEAKFPGLLMNMKYNKECNIVKKSRNKVRKNLHQLFSASSHKGDFEFFKTNTLHIEI